MSAWYVLSSMGIYNVTPGMEEWEATMPYFNEAKIDFENGKTFKVTKDILPANLVSTDVVWDNTPKEGSVTLDKTFFEMHDFETIIPSPVIGASGKAFTYSMDVTFLHPSAKGKVMYRITPYGKDKKGKFSVFDEKLTLKESSIVEVFNDDGFGKTSDTVSGIFLKKPNNYTIDIKPKYNRAYHAGGPEGLIDGILGSDNWRKGDWQGYQGQDFEAVIDLQQKNTCKSYFCPFPAGWQVVDSNAFQS